MHGLIFGQLGFHFVQPIYESLKSISKLSRKQKGFFQFILSEVGKQIKRVEKKLKYTIVCIIFPYTRQMLFH